MTQNHETVFVLIIEDNTQDSYSYDVVAVTDDWEIADRWEKLNALVKYPVELVAKKVLKNHFDEDTFINAGKLTKLFMKEFNEENPL